MGVQVDENIISNCLCNFFFKLSLSILFLLYSSVVIDNIFWDVFPNFFNPINQQSLPNVLALSQKIYPSHQTDYSFILSHDQGDSIFLYFILSTLFTFFFRVITFSQKKNKKHWQIYPT